MNTDQLIDQLHEANTRRLRADQPLPRPTPRPWVPAVAAAIVLLLAVAPLLRHRTPTVEAQADFYCNTGCSAQEVQAIIDENIHHIRTLNPQSL